MVEVVSQEEMAATARLWLADGGKLNDEAKRMLLKSSCGQDRVSVEKRWRVVDRKEEKGVGGKGLGSGHRKCIVLPLGELQAV